MLTVASLEATYHVNAWSQIDNCLLDTVNHLTMMRFTRRHNH